MHLSNTTEQLIALLFFVVLLLFIPLVRNKRNTVHNFLGMLAAVSELENIGDDVVDAPTLQMAMKWLREVSKHNYNDYPQFSPIA